MIKHPNLHPFVPTGTLIAERWHGLVSQGAAASLVVTGATAYWVYIGQAVEAFVPKYVACYCTVAGSGAQTAEVAIAYTITPPNKANQTLYSIVTTGTVDALTGTGVKRNTAAFTARVNVGTHVWAGIRVDMASTEPTFAGYNRDWGRGTWLTTAGASALTGGGPWTGSLIAATATTVEVPVLWLEED